MALALPEAYEEFPWGECAVKMRGKTFLFTRNDDSGLHLTVKLPHSREFALEYPFTQPTGYGLGRSGWVTASFPRPSWSSVTTSWTTSSAPRREFSPAKQPTRRFGPRLF